MYNRHMAKKRRKNPLDVKPGEGSCVNELAGIIQSLLTVEGVEGIGQPVTLITPSDLPPDFLCLIERLCGGAIENDEEMILITLANLRRRRQHSDPILERLRQAILLLGLHAMDNGATVGDLPKNRPFHATTRSRRSCWSIALLATGCRASAAVSA